MPGHELPRPFPNLQNTATLIELTTGAGLRDGGVLHQYSLVGDVAEVPAYDVLFRQVTLRGWWLNVWLASLTMRQRQAALQACPLVILNLARTVAHEVSGRLLSEKAEYAPVMDLGRAAQQH